MDNGVDLTTPIYDFDANTGRIVKQYGPNGVVTAFDIILRAFKQPDFEYRKIKNAATGELEYETEKDRFGRDIPKRILKEKAAAEDFELGQLIFRLQTHYVLARKINLTNPEIETIEKIVHKQFPDSVLYTQICDILERRDEQLKTDSATRTLKELYAMQKPIEYEITIDSIENEADPVKLKNIVKNVLVLLQAEKSEHPAIRQFLKKVKTVEPTEITQTEEIPNP